MRIGKILVDSHPETHEARVIFAKFPSDIAERKVLLLYPIMSSGNKVCRALQVLKENKVGILRVCIGIGFLAGLENGLGFTFKEDAL